MQDEHNEKIKNLDENDDIYFALLENIEKRKNQKLEAIEAYSKKRKFQKNFYQKKVRLCRRANQRFDGFKKKQNDNRI